MSEIIKNGQIVNDEWTILRLSEDQRPEVVDVPNSDVIVPLAVWQAQHATLSRRANVGVWLGSSERAETLKADLPTLPVIAVEFPKFSDGRGYSIAYNLRGRLGYQGELRAIGDVLRAFVTRADRSIHDALKGLTDFSVSYQTSIDQKSPLFRREERPAREVSHAS